MEAAGIEPASEKLTVEGATCLFCDQVSLKSQPQTAMI